MKKSILIFSAFSLCNFTLGMDKEEPKHRQCKIPYEYTDPSGHKHLIPRALQLKDKKLFWCLESTALCDENGTAYPLSSVNLTRLKSRGFSLFLSKIY